MNATVIVETVHGLKDVIVVGTGGVLATTNQVAAPASIPAVAGKKLTQSQSVADLPNQSMAS